MLAPYLRLPFAFYGHSMGAAITFELARSLREHGRPLPSALYVSGCRAPQFRFNWTPPAEPGERELLDQLGNLNGLENPDVLRHTWPALRADTALYRNVYTPGELASPDFRLYGSFRSECKPDVRRGLKEQPQ